MDKMKFDEYYKMSVDELNNIDIDSIPDIEGELVMIISNPHTETYEELKNIYAEVKTSETSFNEMPEQNKTKPRIRRLKYDRRERVADRILKRNPNQKVYIYDIERTPQAVQIRKR